MNVTLEEALDYIALLTKTFWKPISSNAIFVTEDNVTKRRDYEDEVVKVFYLKNPTTVQEFQELVQQVRSVADIRRMFQYNAQNAVIVRDTVDKVALVEKLLHDLDKPKAEVVVDLIVMEANSDRTRDLASALTFQSSNGPVPGLAVPLAFTPRNAITQPSGSGDSGAAAASSTTAIALNNLGRISSADFSTTLPGALLKAVMSDNTTRVMQSPEVRASDGQKVDLKIGDRVPYATGSFQPGVGTVGVSPLVSTQFQFVDTGVNLTITPHVHGDDEVTLHVSVDLSNVTRTVSLGGLDQPVISQRKSETDIRLRDGEVSLLGGLIQTMDSSSVSGIPGLTNIPILGKYMFGSTSKDKSRGELLIALDTAHRSQAGNHRYGSARHRGGNRSDGEVELRAASGRNRARQDAHHDDAGSSIGSGYSGAKCGRARRAQRIAPAFVCSTRCPGPIVGVRGPDATSGQCGRPVGRAGSREMGSEDSAAEPGHARRSHGGERRRQSAQPGYSQRLGRGVHRSQPDHRRARSQRLGGLVAIYVHGGGTRNHQPRGHFGESARFQAAAHRGARALGVRYSAVGRS